MSEVYSWENISEEVLQKEYDLYLEPKNMLLKLSKTHLAFEKFDIGDLRKISTS